MGSETPEASPVDRIWGASLAADDERIENPLQWKGTNLLGFALMEVRDQLIAKDPDRA
ncbi:MAG: NADAR family protein [Paenibacillus sp.]|nr:NADAR family protein [Paenibacillus sp.]